MQSFRIMLLRSLNIAMIKRLGGKKGDLSKALEEAMKLWITKD